MLTSTSFATFCDEKGTSKESLVEVRFETDEQIVRCLCVCLCVSVSVCVPVSKSVSVSVSI